jgi:hypothetical protein
MSEEESDYKPLSKYFEEFLKEKRYIVYKNAVTIEEGTIFARKNSVDIKVFTYENKIKISKAIIRKYPNRSPYSTIKKRPIVPERKERTILSDERIFEMANPKSLDKAKEFIEEPIIKQEKQK